MPLVDRALPLFEALLHEVRVLMRGLEFERDNQQQIVAASLLATVVELSEGILIALRAPNGSSAFILLRSQLEAFVDLLNVAKHAEYLSSMEAAFLDQQRRILACAVEKGETSPFLAGIAGDANVENRLEEVRSRLRQLKDRGVVPLSVKARFEKAEQLPYYEGPYAHLCWHSHNNINVLEDRHVRQSGEEIELVVYAPLEDGDVQIVTDTSAGLAANSVAAVKRLALAEGGKLTGLAKLSRRLEELRGVWQKSA